jgi:hypothetical protein
MWGACIGYDAVEELAAASDKRLAAVAYLIHAKVFVFDDVAVIFLDRRTRFAAIGGDTHAAINPS